VWCSVVQWCAARAREETTLRPVRRSWSDLRVMQCVVVCGSVLQCRAACCSVMQRDAV